MPGPIDERTLMLLVVVDLLVGSAIVALIWSRLRTRLARARALLAVLMSAVLCLIPFLFSAEVEDAPIMAVGICVFVAATIEMGARDTVRRQVERDKHALERQRMLEATGGVESAASRRATLLLVFGFVAVLVALIVIPLKLVGPDAFSLSDPAVWLVLGVLVVVGSVVALMQFLLRHDPSGAQAPPLPPPADAGSRPGWRRGAMALASLVMIPVMLWALLSRYSG